HPSLTKKYGPVLSQVGQGTHAVCFLLKDKQTVAKKIKHNECSLQDKKRLVKREFDIQSGLNHPHLLKTIDLVFERHDCFQIIEFCSKGDLLHLVQTKQVTLEQKQVYFGHLLDGLDYLHTHGVCHRDIKPENLLVSCHDLLKISDFGSAQVFQDKKETFLCSGKMGSERYLAPEVFEADYYFGPPTDVWACGIVYLCIIYEQFPWRAAHMEDPQFQHFLETRTHKLLLRTGSQMAKLIQKMLDPCPVKRITSGEAL
ncbi:kinase-like domain-containing protein, partial [Gorgonomyces haynaldii]